MKKTVLIFILVFILAASAFALDGSTYTFKECPKCRSYNAEDIEMLEPTETVDGYILFRCKDCSHVFRETLPALGCSEHDWEEDKRVNPTYSADGYVIYSCFVCGDSYRETLPMLVCTDHQWVEQFRQEATPSLPGQIFYVCILCADEKTEEIPIPHDHVWVEIQRTEPTEDGCGLVVSQCQICNQQKEVELDWNSAVFPEVTKIGKTFLSASWKMFNVQVPGFQFSFGQMYLGIALCSLSLTVAGLIFGIRFGGDSPRTSSTDHPKISKERRNDEY